MQSINGVSSSQLWSMAWRSCLSGVVSCCLLDRDLLLSADRRSSLCCSVSLLDPKSGAADTNLFWAWRASRRAPSLTLLLASRASLCWGVSFLLRSLSRSLQRRFLSSLLLLLPWQLLITDNNNTKGIQFFFFFLLLTRVIITVYCLFHWLN